jgi:5,10-methylenetetrahydromethanopterin reductase
MRIGLHIVARPRVGPDGPSLESFERVVRAADAYGFERIGTGDSQLNNLECFSALTLMATLTRQARLGPQVTNPVTRDVGVIAGALGSLDLISNGRAFCVLGRGDGAVHNAGLPPASVAQTRAVFLAIRELLERGQTTYQGRTVRYQWPTYWPGRTPRKIPLHLVAEGPRMLALAGEVADGALVGAGLTPPTIQGALEALGEGARTAGRDPGGLDLWWSARFAIAPTREEALDRVKDGLASAGNHALRSPAQMATVPRPLREPLARYHAGYDYAQKGLGSRKNVALMDELGLTGYFLERFGVAGTPADVVDRLRQLDQDGVTGIILQVNPAYPEGLDLLGREVLPRVR